MQRSSHHRDLDRLWSRPTASRSFTERRGPTKVLSERPPTETLDDLDGTDNFVLDVDDERCPRLPMREAGSGRIDPR